MEIIAHRGASYDAPENTLAAVNLAWAQGADAVEIDVHLSRDGRVAVIHDDNTRKTSGFNAKVCNQLWDDLRKLDVGGWKGSKWKGEYIPELEEVLATVPSGKRLFIEVKCREQFIDAAAQSLQGKSGKQLVIIGFSLETMKRLKSNFPVLEVCWIVEFKRRLPSNRWSPSPARVIEQARAAGLDGLDVGANGPLTRQFVQNAKAAGLGVYVWTVDSAAKARRLRDAGVDGITTNKPGWMRQQLQRP